MATTTLKGMFGGRRIVEISLASLLALTASTVGAACAADTSDLARPTETPANLERRSVDVSPTLPTASSTAVARLTTTTLSAQPTTKDSAVPVIEPATPPPPPPLPPTPIPDPVPTAAPPAPYTPGDRPPLAYGASGPAVTELQARLAQLGYRPDGDGYYGDSTADAVLALRKAERLPRSYDVDGDVWARLDQPLGLRPAATGPPRIEVDLDRQVLFVVLNGQVITLNTSTGNGETYTDPETGWEEVAETPTGRFAIYEAFDGDVKAPLGTLYRPLYFLRGWAVHGSGFVPSWPDSHGCARLSYPDIDFVWSLGAITTGTTVVVHPSMGPPPAAPAPSAPAAPAVETPPADTPAS